MRVHKKASGLIRSFLLKRALSLTSVSQQGILDSNQPREKVGCSSVFRLRYARGGSWVVCSVSV